MTMLHELPTKPAGLDEGKFDLTRMSTLKPSPKFGNEFTSGRTFEPSRSASGVLLQDLLGRALWVIRLAWAKNFNCVELAAYEQDVELLELLLLRGEKIPSEGEAADRLREIAKEADARRAKNTFDCNLDKVLQFLDSQ